MKDLVYPRYLAVVIKTFKVQLTICTILIKKIKGEEVHFFWRRPC